MAKRSAPHVITLLDEVEKCEKEIVETLFSLPDGAPVQIVINSGGGSVYASMGIATALRLKNFKSEAIVLADCSSSALMVFAACPVRRVARHASFLFHPMKWSSEDQSRLHGALSWSEEFTRISKVTEDWLVDNLPMNRRTLRNWIRKERYVEAQELFDRGIAEELDLGEEGVIEVMPKTRSKPRRRSTSRTTTIRKVG